MAKRNNDINRKISRAQSYARVKMQRIRDQQRFDVRGSSHNPISTTPVSDMSPDQKRAYLRKLNKFNSRANQFHVSARRTVLTEKGWQKYKAAEAAGNAAVRADVKKYEKLKLPAPAKGTVGDYLEKFRPAFGRLGHNNPSGTAMHEVKRQASAIEDERALRRLTKSLNDKTNPNYHRKKLRQGRKQFRQMVETFGDSDLMRLGDALTDEQFKVLWNYTNFADAISLAYVVYQQSLIHEESFHAFEMDTAGARAREWITWASENV